jgi:predicted ATPase
MKSLVIRFVLISSLLLATFSPVAMAAPEAR